MKFYAALVACFLKYVLATPLPNENTGGLQSITAGEEDAASLLYTLQKTANELDAKVQSLDRMNLVETILELVPELRSKMAPPNLPNDCATLRKDGAESSGQYLIKPHFSEEPMEVYCDMETDGGGWTVFHRRLDGSQDFERSWDAYKFGFGDLYGEFWLGNDKLSQLTLDKSQQLRIDMESFVGERKYAAYDVFSVGSEQTSYRLTVDNYHGDSGDSMNTHNGMRFSTSERDNDNHSSNCADTYKGGWWYNGCHHANLNGVYGQNDSKGNVWYQWLGHKKAMKTSEMKVRPVDFGVQE